MYIFGKNVAREKINSGEKINKIYISDKFRDEEIFNLIIVLFLINFWIIK